MSRKSESLSSAPAASPWPGLAAYGEAERGCFFGRDTEVQEIADSVRTHRITVLHGPAGSGKSSLLAAGLAPFLRESGCPVHLLRLDSTAAAPAAEIQFRTALAELCASEALPSRAWLERWGTLSLAAIMDDPAMLPADWGIVPRCLLLDQFEEVFPFGRAGARKLELPALFTALADITAQPQLPGKPHRRRDCGPGCAVVHVLVSLRSDFLPRLEPWLRQVPALDHRILLAPLDGLRAAEVLLGPRGEDGTPLVEPAAARRIVQLAAGCDDSTPLEEIRAVPPFLSLLCRQLSQAAPDGRIREEAVRTGTTAILHRFYEDSLAAHPPAVRQYIEDHLVSAAGRRESVPRAAMEAALADADIPDAACVIDDLLARRLLTARTSGNSVHVELAHDQLADVVQPGHLALREAEEKRETEVRTVLLRRDRREQWSRYLRNIRRTALAGIACVALSAGWLTLRHQQDMAEEKAREAASALRLQEARVKAAAASLQRLSQFASLSSELHQILERLAHAADAAGWSSGIPLESAIVPALRDYRSVLERTSTAGEPRCSLAVISELARMSRNSHVLNTLPSILRKYPLRLPLRVLEVREKGFADRVEALSDDGELAYIEQHGRMVMLEVLSGKVRWAHIQKTPTDAVFSGDGQYLIGTLDERPGVWRASTGEKVWQQQQKMPWNAGPGPEEVTVWREETRGDVIDISTGRTLRATSREPRRAGVWKEPEVVRGERSPDGSIVAMSVPGEGVRIWDSRTLREVMRLRDSNGESVWRYSGNGILLWTEGGHGRRGYLCGWEVVTGRCRYMIPGILDSYPPGVTASKDGSTVAVQRGELICIYRVPGEHPDLTDVAGRFAEALRFSKNAIFRPRKLGEPLTFGQPVWFPDFLTLLAGIRIGEATQVEVIPDKEWLEIFTRLCRIARNDQSAGGPLLRQSLGMGNPH